MPNINELGLLDETLPVDTKNLPEQPQGFELLQPGNGYTFVLPDSEILSEAFDVIQTANGQRLEVTFGGKASLKTTTGARVFTRIDNKEFTAGKKGEEKLTSNLAYLLTALGAVVTKGNKSYADAILAHAGESFVADWTWTAYCNPKEKIYNEAGGREEKLGCGAEYAIGAYTKKKDQKQVIGIPKDEDGRYAEHFICSTEDCGAAMRAFGKIRNIRAK